MTTKTFFQKALKGTGPLFNLHKNAVKNYNQQSIVPAFLISMFILLIPMTLSIFRQSMQPTLPAYLSTFLAVFILLCLNQISVIQNKPLILIYTLGLIWYALAIYLSIFRFNDRPAGILLIYFVVAPLLFIDKSYKINIFITILFLIHIVLSYQMKVAEVAGVDLINTLSSAVIGMLFGRLFLISRLDNFEIEKLMIIEKETDFLTGLFNRRKLFEHYEMIQALDRKLLIMMMDIDEFKNYNDTYGHISGDTTLINFSKLLKDINKEYPIYFYRFGGEEFIGISTEVSMKMFLQIAEKIRSQTPKIKMSDRPITVSIGVASCSDIRDKNVDEVLELADKALYKAKRQGKNKVQMNMET